MNPFWLYLLLTATGVPLVIWRLHMANQVLHEAPARIVTTSTPTPQQSVVLVAAVPAQAPARDDAPDLPEVTPRAVVKAGEVRRVQGPPCHDCHCCAVYATRIEQAHLEIDRLRDELLDTAAHGLRRAASHTTPRNVVAIRS